MWFLSSKATIFRAWFATLLILAGVVLPQPQALAVDTGELKKILSSQPGDKAGNSMIRQALIADGRERSYFCAYCHGEDGNSKLPLVPNLAGQNPFYLLEQIEKFADGRRKDYIMTPLSKNFSTENKIALSLYYANMPPRARAADATLALKGKTYYFQKCISCHGKKAHGGEQYARLASQHPQYLRRRLYSMQRATGNAATVMTSIAITLSDKEVEALAAYLSTLP